MAQAEEHGFPVCALVAEAWSDEATFYVFRAQGMFLSRMAAHSAGGLSIFPIPLAGSRWYGKRFHKGGIRFLLWQIPVYKKAGAGGAAQCAK